MLVDFWPAGNGVIGRASWQTSARIGRRPATRPGFRSPFASLAGWPTATWQALHGHDTRHSAPQPNFPSVPVRVGSIEGQRILVARELQEAGLLREGDRGAHVGTRLRACCVVEGHSCSPHAPETTVRRALARAVQAVSQISWDVLMVSCTTL
jgi:hypothetical protein